MVNVEETKRCVASASTVTTGFNPSRGEIVKRLKQDILAMQGVLPAMQGVLPVMQGVSSAKQGVSSASNGRVADAGLGAVAEAFPYGVFPVGIHEFVSTSRQSSAATSGFIAGIMGSIVQAESICLWVSSGRTLYPAGLRFFGVNPERVIFVDTTRSSDLSWMIEQALKCNSLGAVVGEVAHLDLAQSRRLQLAVEESRVNCLLHRRHVKAMQGIASVCRWKIQPVPGVPQGGLPGVGFPAWNVTLEKVRNGQPGSWQLQWVGDHFVPSQEVSLGNDLERADWVSERRVTG